MPRTVINAVVDERTTTRLSAVMKDELAVAIPGSSVSACTLTLYVADTETIINGRDDVNILNANGGSWDSSGNFALELTPADNQIVTSANAREEHVALIEWTYSSGKQGKQEFVFIVRNMPKVS